jgi:hypothetical protein
MVSEDRLANGVPGAYINRTLYLVRLEHISREQEGFSAMGRASQALQEVVAAARDLVP